MAIADTKNTGTMIPVSGRLPEELYQWLSTLPLEGATTVSDRIRIAVATLKRLHDGDSDYMGALGMQRDLVRNTRDQIASLERNAGVHSAVLAAFVDHVPGLVALLNAAQIKDSASARELEEQLVRRLFQLTEALLRQVVTTEAAAFDVHVVHKQAPRFIELVQAIISTNQIRGDKHG
ncbi:MAG: hypothetical protein ING64_02400 [Rhodocyclaceae bacterium]|jgi:hypothetical protein|nr:hypothetical protein [Rhodocyclaceae bacterium]MCA3055204.1 hypothetical protein [Rhodocyclaceae bacterium]